jgi:two-component system response regulator FixJ
MFFSGRINHFQRPRDAMEKHDELPGRGAVVFIVEDDPAVRGSLKFSLQIEGFKVCDFASAAGLLNASDLPACSCLVIDQKIPGMTGLDLIAELRERQIFAPAILITTHPNAALIAGAARANTPIVEKPLLGNALMDRIRAACTQSNSAHP